MRAISSALLTFALVGCPKGATPPEPATGLTYPDALRGDVVDDYNGVKVPDPYRWLEDPDSPETRAWIDAENALTRSVLDAVPERAAIEARLTALYDFERYGVPFKQGGRYFYDRNDGLQDQSVLYVAQSLDGEPRVLVDPNTLSTDGTVSLAGTSVSEDGRHLAYATSDGGSDWQVWRVRNVETGQDTADEIRWTKWGGPAWSHDGRGFFYTRYPVPENPLEQVNENNTIWWHDLGTPQSEDDLVLEIPEQPKWGFDVQVSEDGRFLLVSQGEGTEHKNRLWTWAIDPKDTDGPPLAGELVKVVDDYEAAWWYLGNRSDRFFFFTNLDAPRGRVVAIDFDGTPGGTRTEIVPEAAEAVESFTMVGGRIVGTYLKDAHSVVRVFEADGTPAGEIALPGLGSAWGFGGRNDDPETFFGFGGFTTPTTIYRADISTLETQVFKKPEVGFDPDDFETEQVFYQSEDGTRVPMFIVHKKGLEIDGNVPTLLYGYGGFNVSITPWFKVRNLVWLEMGGIYASANIRGGGEYGEEWHEAGTLAKKQNVFDDFVAAAEWLVANGYTKPEKLAIHGASNGGLLVGATMTQRPDLCAAALPAVGVMDMLRYHLFTIGWAWASDYGKADDKEMFPVLYAYSPYHSLQPGTRYPSTLVTTGDHDDRVVPAHSFKFAAALQQAHAGDNPVLIRIETRAGHGAGKSTAMQIDEFADQWAFLVRELHMTLPADFGQGAAAE